MRKKFIKMNPKDNCATLLEEIPRNEIIEISKDQIIKTMKDLKAVNVDFLTIGQYLQPSKNHAEIKKYYTPEEFTELKELAYTMGFKHVESGPLVRSSYHAQDAFI